MKKLHWTDSEFDRTYFLFQLKSIKLISLFIDLLIYFSSLCQKVIKISSDYFFKNISAIKVVLLSVPPCTCTCHTNTTWEAKLRSTVYMSHVHAEKIKDDIRQEVMRIAMISSNRPRNGIISVQQHTNEPRLTTKMGKTETKYMPTGMID